MDTIKLEDLEIYILAQQIGEDVWQIVAQWEYFAKEQWECNL